VKYCPILIIFGRNITDIFWLEMVVLLFSYLTKLAFSKGRCNAEPENAGLKKCRTWKMQEYGVTHESDCRRV